MNIQSKIWVAVLGAVVIITALLVFIWNQSKSTYSVKQTPIINSAPTNGTLNPGILYIDLEPGTTKLQIDTIVHSAQVEYVEGGTFKLETIADTRTTWFTPHNLDELLAQDSLLDKYEFTSNDRSEVRLYFKEGVNITQINSDLNKYKLKPYLDLRDPFVEVNVPSGQEDAYSIKIRKFDHVYSAGPTYSVPL